MTTAEATNLLAEMWELCPANCEGVGYRRKELEAGNLLDVAAAYARRSSPESAGKAILCAYRLLGAEAVAYEGDDQAKGNGWAWYFGRHPIQVRAAEFAVMND